MDDEAMTERVVELERTVAAQGREIARIRDAMTSAVAVLVSGLTVPTDPPTTGTGQ